jgi:hypothetical protein
MTSWPRGFDYLNAVDRPATVFRDPCLQAYDVERKKQKPWVRSGNFAVVFKLLGADGDLAARFFLYPEKGREEYFRRVDAHLRRGRPACMVGFSYDDRGARIAGESYPLLTMDWVPGDKLMPWIEERMARGVPGEVGRLADAWSDAIRELGAHGIAHGDLHHDNILIVDDRPVLVDYDEIFIESVAELQLERKGFGLPAYQHPRRDENSYGPGLDHFSAWVIWLGLRAVAAEPGLWQRFVRDVGNDNLLFTDFDHVEPNTSPVWNALMESSDPEVRHWAARIRATLPDAAFESVPRFAPEPTMEPVPIELEPEEAVAIEEGTTCAHCKRPNPPEALFCYHDGRPLADLVTPIGKPIDDSGFEVIEDDEPVSPPHRPSHTGSAHAGSAHGGSAHGDTDILGRKTELGGAAGDDGLLECLKALCEHPTPDWDEIASTADKLRSKGIAIPPTCAERAREAELRVRCCEKVAGAIADRRLSQVVAHYDSKLLDDWDKCKHMVSRARRARELLGRIAEIAEALRTGNAQTAIERWASAKDELDGLDESRGLAAQIRLCELLVSPKPSEKRIVALADELARSGIVLSSPIANRVRKASRFVESAKRFPPAGAAPSEESDGRVIEAWSGMLGCPEAQDYQSRFDEAQNRLSAVKRLSVHVAQVEGRAASEQSLIDAAESESLPENYEHRHRKRIEKARIGAPLLAQLEKELDAARPSDQVIANLARKLRQQGTYLTEAQEQACNAATERFKVLKDLERIDPSLSEEEQDRKWASELNEELFAARSDADRHRARAKLAADRLRKAKELTDSIRAKNYLLTAQLADDPLLTGYPVLEAHRAAIDSSRKWAGKIRQIRSLLEMKDSARFAEEADFGFLRSHSQLFRAEWARIERHAKDWLSRVEVLKAAPNPWRYDSEGVLESVRWTWPYFDQITFCWVVADPARFYERHDEAPKRSPWNAESYRTAESSFPIVPFGLRQVAYVTVWPVLELGWVNVVGRPLTIGPVKLRRTGPGGSGRGDVRGASHG